MRALRSQCALEKEGRPSARLRVRPRDGACVAQAVVAVIPVIVPAAVVPVVAVIIPDRAYASTPSTTSAAMPAIMSVMTANVMPVMR